MDNRSRLDKIRALASDERGNHHIRAIAQKMLAKETGKSDTRQPTYEEAYKKFTEVYTHVGHVWVNGVKMPKKYRPESVATHRQLDFIFSKYTSWKDILPAMYRCYGKSSGWEPT